VCPCDLPGIEVDQVRRLVAARPAVARGAPLFGVFPAERAAAALEAARAGGPVRRFVEGMPIVELGELANLNQI
jgi:hypothetical protein